MPRAAAKASSALASKSCERGGFCLTSIIHLCRRAKLTGKPAGGFGCHRIRTNLRFMDVSALRASQRPMLKAGAARGRALNQRGGLTLRTAGTRYRAWRQNRCLNFGHGYSLDRREHDTLRHR